VVFPGGIKLPNGTAYDARFELKSVAIRVTTEGKAHLGFLPGKPFIGRDGAERAGSSPFEIFEANTKNAMTHIVFSKPELKSIKVEFGRILAARKAQAAAPPVQVEAVVSIPDDTVDFGAGFTADSGDDGMPGIPSMGLEALG